MKFNVLVIDDEFINRKLLSTLLVKNDKIGTIYEADNGLIGLDMLQNKNTKIDFILLDIVMPVMNGIEFLQIFRNSNTHSTIPIIVISTDDVRKTEVLNLGADDFLLKPVREIQLTEKLNRMLI